MGYHDRADDGGYSKTLRTTGELHPYLRRHAHSDPTFASSLAKYTSLSQPHVGLHRISLPAAKPLPDGTPIMCENTATGPVIRTQDGAFLGHVSPADASDLRANLDKGPIRGKAAEGHIDLEWEE